MGNTFDGRLLDERQGTSFGEVAYGVFGEEGPPVVLVHGTPSRSHIWREIVGVPWASSPPHDRSYKARGAGSGDTLEEREKRCATMWRKLPFARNRPSRGAGPLRQPAPSGPAPRSRARRPPEASPRNPPCPPAG